MNGIPAEFNSSPALAELGYDEVEATIVVRAAVLKKLPLRQFAIDLMACSVHEAAHQMAVIWQGGTDVKSHLELVWPEHDEGPMVAGHVAFSGLDDMTSRRVVAVAGAVAELLMPDPLSESSLDEWDLYVSLRDGRGVSPGNLALADGKITWHAVKRAAKLLRRHWSIIRLVSGSKRKALLYQLTDEFLYLPRRQSQGTRAYF